MLIFLVFFIIIINIIDECLFENVWHDGFVRLPMFNYFWIFMIKNWTLNEHGDISICVLFAHRVAYRSSTYVARKRQQQHDSYCRGMEATHSVELLFAYKTRKLMSFNLIESNSNWKFSTLIDWSCTFEPRHTAHSKLLTANNINIVFIKFVRTEPTVTLKSGFW